MSTTQQPRGGDRKPWKLKREALRDPDKKATRTAGRQWGALTRQQALEAGLTQTQISYSVQTGQWRQPARGVYVIAGVPGGREQGAAGRGLTYALCRNSYDKARK